MLYDTLDTFGNYLKDTQMTGGNRQIRGQTRPKPNDKVQKMYLQIATLHVRFPG